MLCAKCGLPIEPSKYGWLHSRRLEETPYANYLGEKVWVYPAEARSHVVVVPGYLRGVSSLKAWAKMLEEGIQAELEL